ncbi:MAG: hypothetical protein ABSA82_08995, partial [Thermacetogeniaceae bacterium]
EPAFRPGVSPDTGAHRFGCTPHSSGRAVSPDAEEAGALERVVICGKAVTTLLRVGHHKDFGITIDPGEIAS